MNIQAKKAAELRRKWKNKSCDHPDFGREYMNSIHTGDYICVKCGECFTGEEVREIEEKRSKK